MAHSRRITDWVAENRKSLRPALTLSTWTSDWLPDYFDYEACIAVGGKEFYGRGTARCESLAKDMAFAEAFENLAALENGLKHRCGMAAFPDLEGAKMRAYFELLSADRAICHHLTQAPFKELPFTLLSKSLDLSTLLASLAQNHLTMKIFEMRPSLDAFCAIAFLWDETALSKGVIAGFGAGPSLVQAAGHATIECLREGVAIFVGGIGCPASLDDLYLAASPQWHFWQAQCEIRLETLRRQLTRSADWGPERISFDSAEFTQFFFGVGKYQDFPLKIVKVTTPELITPTFGAEFLASSHTMRLEKFVDGRAFSVNKEPHYYG